MPMLRREIVQIAGRMAWSVAVVVSGMWLLGVTSSADVLDDFAAQFTDPLTPLSTSIQVPPPVVVSVLRERYLADFDAEQFASQLSDVDAAHETTTVPTELMNHQSDLRPVALEIQIRQLETLAPGLAHSRTEWVNEGNDATRVVSPLINEVVLHRLRHLIAEVVYCFDHTPAAARRPLDELHACVTLLQKDAALSEQDAIVLCVEMLKRRLILWEQALFARVEYDKAIASLATVSLQKRQELLEWTSLTRKFLRSKELAPHGMAWANEWEIAALEELLTRCQRDTQLTESEVLQIADYARRLVAALDPASFTATQRRWLRIPGIQEWRKSLAPWGQTFIDPFELLRAVERFEASPSPETEKQLHAIATLMAASPHRAWATLGKTTISLHNSPNVKLYLSSILLNHLLPAPEQEYARFRDVVGGRNVAGRRRTETQVSLTTISNDDAVQFSLNVRGRVAALGTTSALTTTLQSLSSAEYFGRKVLEWTDAGFKFSPAAVTVNNTRTSLHNVQASLGIPILGGMMSNVVRSQYEMQQDDIKNETTSKIVQQTRARINSETEQQCSQVTRWYRENVIRTAESLGLTVAMRESRTDEHWLLPAWRVGKNGDLASYPPAPETPIGAFADFKVHESIINMIIDSLDIGGKTMTIGELRGVIGKRFDQAAMLQETENDDMVVCLAAERPLRLRLHDGRIDLVLGVERLTVNQQTMRDFQVFATYVPEEMPDGSLELMRDGIVRLGGEILPRHQIPLRTVFGKVFAAQRRIEMSPAMLRDDERFEGFTLGLSRIEHGWFAVALVTSHAGEATSHGTSVPNAPATTAHRIRRSAR